MVRNLRDRLDLPSIEERIDQAAAEEEFNRIFEEEIGLVSWRDEHDEGHQPDGRPPFRSSNGTQRSGILNLDQALRRALERVDDKRIQPEWVNGLASAPVREDDRYNRYVEEMQADVRNNFMYDLFLEQLFEERSEAISPSFPTFGLFVALKAALKLLATRPALCDELDIDDRQLRDDAVIYYDQLTRGLHPHTAAEDFISSAIYEVQGLGPLATRILAAYETAVVAERRAAKARGESVDDTPLPNDTDEQSDRSVEKDQALERALVMVETSTQTVKVIAKQYGIGDKRLSREAKKRGIARPQGRPKGGRLCLGSPMQQ